MIVPSSEFFLFLHRLVLLKNEVRDVIFFFFLLLYNMKMSYSNKPLGTSTFLCHFFRRSFNVNSIEKKIGELAKKKNQGSDPANPYTYPNSLQGSAEVKGKPLWPAAWAAPESPREEWVPAWGMAAAAAPYNLCTVVNVIVLCRVCLAPARLGHFLPQHLAPCPSVWMPTAKRKRGGPETRRASRSKRSASRSECMNGDNRRRSGGAGRGIALIHPFL